MPAIRAPFIAKFGVAISGFSSETKDPKLHKLDVFEEISIKSHNTVSVKNSVRNCVHAPNRRTTFE